MKNQPSLAFVFVSWTALCVGALAYLIGLWNADIMLNEKGTLFTLLMFGLFSAVSVQKSVRDREEGIPVTDTYYGISWVAAIIAVLLLTISLWGATMTLSEKGFYAMAYTMSMFAAITVQKNTPGSRKAMKGQARYNFHHGITLAAAVQEGAGAKRLAATA